MDPSRFDRLSRALAGATTRRETLLALLAGLLRVVVADEETEAKRRRGTRRDHRGGKPRGRKNAARGRDQPGGVRAEKKKKKKKKKKTSQSPPVLPPTTPLPSPTPPPSCPDGTTRCGESCVDPASDASNCGSCGAACAAGQVCQGGTCTCNGERCTGCCDGTTCWTGVSAAQCGAGGIACTTCTGGRTCQNGNCACPVGQDVCDDTCVDRQTDSKHCGPCNHECAEGEICQGGVCGIVCGADFCAATGNVPDCCSGTCRNLSADVNHCGACGTACNSQTANRCAGGSCNCGDGGACTGGQTCCGGACRDLRTDVAHCGACGRVCSIANAQATCIGSACGFACETGFADCNGVADDGCEVDTRSDAVHCGGCGIACDSQTADRCSGGVCRCGNGDPCLGGQTCCTGVCRDLSTSFAHCGACGRACPTTTNWCDAGNCRCGNDDPCPAGQTCCTGVCRTLSTDEANCGACGHACVVGEVCVGGHCRCGDGDACDTYQTCCTGGSSGPGTCRDLTTDVNHCGTCDSTCPDDETCCTGVCASLSTDETHCGGCGSACTSRADRCVGGSCKCGDGDPCPERQRCCDGICRNTDTDNNNCGRCGEVCLGHDQPTANAGCTGGFCTFSCKGQNYDVNGDRSDGCEQLDEQGNHTQDTALDLGARPCLDTSVGSFAGSIYSDTRPHMNPPAPGYEPSPGTGAAPLWFKVVGSGGECQNNPRVELTLTSGTMNNVYRITVVTDKTEASATVFNGSAVVAMGSDSYSNDSTIYFKVEKKPFVPSVGEMASFTAVFHL